MGFSKISKITKNSCMSRPEIANILEFAEHLIMTSFSIRIVLYIVGSPPDQEVVLGYDPK